MVWRRRRRRRKARASCGVVVAPQQGSTMPQYHKTMYKASVTHPL